MVRVTGVSMIIIQPVGVYPQTATQVAFGSITLVPFEKAVTEWYLYNTAGLRLATGTVETTPIQYAAWGTDDNYITDCFLLNLGLIKA